MSGPQRSFFLNSPAVIPPATRASFLTIPPTQMNAMQQQSFIAHNSMLAAQAAIASSTGTVPVSIVQLGTRGRPATTILGQPVSTVPIPRASETVATEISNEEEFEWFEYLSQEGKPYYHNKVTKVTTWNKPERYKPGVQGATTMQQKSASPTSQKKSWKEYKNEEGRSYYHNHETGETTWTRPPEIDDETATPKKETLSPVVGQDTTAVPLLDELPTQFSMAESIDIDIPLPRMTDMEKAMEATLKNLPPPEAPKPVEVSVDPEELKLQQMQKFRELLIDKYNGGRLKSTMSWEQAQKHIQHDPRFRIVPKVSERKRIFNEWKNQQQKDERDARKLALRKAKEDFENFLLNDRRVLPTMSYSKAERLFGNEDVWKGLGDTDKREIFADTIVRTRKKREDDAKEQRQRLRVQLIELLDSLPDISYQTSWAEAQKIINSCKDFIEHPDFKKMHKVEVLEAFEEYIRKAEKDHSKEREQHEKQVQREERKIRDAFHNMINELQQKGILLYNTRWSQVYPIIRQEERFTAMLKQPGSTPLDIFKFHVHDLETAYRRDRERIREIMHRLDLKVTMEMPFCDFQQKVQSEDPENKIDPNNMNLYFTALLDRAAEGKPTNGDSERERFANGIAEVDKEDGELLDEVMDVDVERPPKDRKRKKEKKPKKEKKHKDKKLKKDKKKDSRVECDDE